MAIPPWLFGGVITTHQVGFLAAAAVGLVGAGLFVLCKRPAGPANPPGLLLVLLAGGLLGAAQLFPIESALHARLSPKAHAWWSTLTSDALFELAEARDQPRRFPLSLYPASTRRDLASLSLPVAMFAVAAVTIRTPARALGMLVLISINGVLTALFGVVHYLTSNGQLYWTVPLTQGGDPFAAYVNRNHAGAYLNLCLAASIGLLVWSIQRRRAEPGCHGGDGPPLTEAEQAPRRPAGIDSSTAILLAFVACAAIAGGTVCSLSRGATAAMLGATLLTLIALWRFPAARLARYGALLVLLGGLALAIWLGRAELLHDRFRDLWQPATWRSTGRLAHWKDGLGAARDFWPTGAGLGLYRYVYRPYQTSYSAGWFYHAENQYLESLVDGGAGGLILVLSAISIVAFASWKLLRCGITAPAFAVSVTGLFAISSQAIHALFDFNLYMPANALLCAVVAAIVVTAKRWPDARRAGWEPHAAWRRAWWISTLAVILAWVIWSMVQTHRTAALDRFRKTLPKAQEYPELTLEAVGQLSTRLRQLITSIQDAADARQWLAELSILGYRLSLADQLGERHEGRIDERVWLLTEPNLLHERCYQLLQGADDKQFAWLKTQPEITDYLALAFAELKQARDACPLLARVHLELARLSILFEPAGAEEVHLERAEEVAGLDVDVLFQAGLIDLQAGRFDDGFRRWRKCVALSERYVRPAVTLGQRLLAPDHLIERLFAGNPPRAVAAAWEFYGDPESAEVRARIADIVEEGLGHTATTEAEASFLQGAISKLRGDLPAAIKRMGRAVELSPKNVAWRHELARALLESGRPREAYDHALICAQLDPHSDRQRRLMCEVRRQLNSGWKTNDH